MASAIVGRPMEILLIEDGLMDARVTIEALRTGQMPHRVTLVRDGQEALLFLRRQDRFAQAPRPDLILLDLNLPKISGLDLLREFRQDESLCHLPVVVLTASEHDADRSQCTEYQVDHFMSKPVNLEKFLAVVKALRKCWRDDLALPDVE